MLCGLHNDIGSLLLAKAAQSTTWWLEAGGYLVVGDNLDRHQVLQGVIRAFQFTLSLKPSWLGSLHWPERNRNLLNSKFKAATLNRQNWWLSKELSHPQLHFSQHRLQFWHVIGQIRAWLLQGEPWHLGWSASGRHAHRAVCTSCGEKRWVGGSRLKKCRTWDNFILGNVT